jgi:hypothetical protein
MLTQLAVTVVNETVCKTLKAIQKDENKLINETAVSVACGSVMSGQSCLDIAT